MRRATDIRYCTSISYAWPKCQQEISTALGRISVRRSDAGAGFSPDWTAAEVRLTPRWTLKIQENGSELTTLYHPLSGLLAETVHFVHFRVNRTPSGPSGSSDELRVEIVDAIDGSVTTDPAGTSNSLGPHS